MIPFHLPHKKCLAGKHRSLRDVIYNNISMAESWTWDLPPCCNCSLLRQQHPRAKFIHGHLASPLAMMSFSKRHQHLLQYSMDSQLFPNLQYYLSITRPVVDRWLRHHNVFTVDFEQWHQFVLQEWLQHTSASFHRLKYKDATFLKQSLRGLFIHGRDHALTHGHVFCQRFVWDTYKATFGDTNVYELLPTQPSQAEVFLGSTTSRPCYSHCLGPYPSQCLPLDTLPGILQKLTVLLQQLPDDADPVVYNQDLVGFFTSIPVSRILNAVRWAVTEYCLVKDVDLESTSFSVNLQEQDTKLRIWKGRPRKAAKRALLIHLSDIVDSQLSCDASVFHSYA